MPLHTTPTLPVHWGPRLALAATIAAVTCASSGAVAIGTSGEQPFAQIASFAEIDEPAFTRYHDIEANKANSMRALGAHIVEQSANPTTRYQDLEANKADSRQAR